MAEKKSEKSPAKKPEKMCDQCELIDGFKGPAGGRFKLCPKYRVTNRETGFVICLCEEHRTLLLPRAYRLPSGRWAVEGRLTELDIQELDTEPAEE